ncbi:MAG: redoxin domain-containing protein [Saprospiraceae bacterium]
MQIGQVAPHIALYNTDRKKIDLNDFKGKKVMLLFFPAAWTGVCTAEMCSVRDDISFYQKLDATVFGISVDSPFALKRFKEDQHISFDLLSDFNKQVIRAYQVYREDFICELHGVANRAVFIIGNEGTIKYQEVLDNSGIMPDFAAAKRALETIQ